MAFMFQKELFEYSDQQKIRKEFFSPLKFVVFQTFFFCLFFVSKIIIVISFLFFFYKQQQFYKWTNDDNDDDRGNSHRDH